MTTNKMHDFKFEQLADGTIRLEQIDCGESCLIDLHLAQVRYLAEALGLLNPAAPTMPRWPRGFVRRMERLRGQAHDLWAFLDSVPSFPPRQEPTEDVIAASDLLDAIDDLLGDFDITPDHVGERPFDSEEAPSATSPCGSTEPSAGDGRHSQGRSEAGNEHSEVSLF